MYRVYTFFILPIKNYLPSLVGFVSKIEEKTQMAQNCKSIMEIWLKIAPFALQMISGSTPALYILFKLNIYAVYFENVTLKIFRAHCEFSGVVSFWNFA